MHLMKLFTSTNNYSIHLSPQLLFMHVQAEFLFQLEEIRPELRAPHLRKRAMPSSLPK